MRRASSVCESPARVRMSRFDASPLPLNFLRQLLLTGQHLHVACGEDLPPLAQHGIVRDGGILLGAENQADRRVVALRALVLVEHADVAVHLADVLMSELPRLEINQHKARCQ